MGGSSEPPEPPLNPPLFIIAVNGFFTVSGLKTKHAVYCIKFNRFFDID